MKFYHTLIKLPYQKKKLHIKKYRINKYKKVNASIKKNIFHNLTPSTSHICPEPEIINQLKEKFKLTTKDSDKIQILTVLPKSWPLRKIEEEFGVTNYMARKAKKLVEEKGVLSTPNPKQGKPLSLEISEAVKTFYETDDISRCMPGLKVSSLLPSLKTKKTLLIYVTITKILTV